ncbi:MAG: ATP-dependent helicase, partial [Candidatus Pacearchaeota archaeon]
ARALQRLGRSGHRLHETPKGRFIIMDRDDIVESCIIQKEMIERKINKVVFPKNCLDVLSQQIFGMAIYKRWFIDEIYELVKKSYCYKTLSKEDFMAVISYLTGEYGLENSQVYAKIWYDEKTKEIGKKGKLARVIYMTNMGTIPEESFVSVKLAPSGEHIGVIDESFLEKMKRGDVFVLGGNKYIYMYTKGMNLYVKNTVDRPPNIPSWFSEMLPLAFDSALEIQRFRKLIDDKIRAGKKEEEIVRFIQNWVYCEENTAKAIYNYFIEQYNFLAIPNENLIIVEKYKAEKNYVVVHSLYGRRVNDALSRAIAYCMAQVGGRDVEIGINDNGFYFAGEKLPIEKAFEFLKPENLEEVLKEAVERTDILARRFRHCAGRALMILRNYKGKQKTVGKQQMKSHFLLSAIRKISSEFPILKEARREVLEDLMDINNAKLVLQWIKEKKVKIKYEQTNLPSPFALNLILQGHSDLIRIEDKQAFLKRMHEMHLKAISKK